MRRKLTLLAVSLYAPNLSRHFVPPDYEIAFRTNALGLRDVPLQSVDAQATRVLALGDSYTQGHGVQVKQAWPRRLDERLPRAHVFDSGVSGYGVQQMRRTAEVLFERLSPRAIVIGVCGNGHTRDGSVRAHRTVPVSSCAASPTGSPSSRMVSCCPSSKRSGCATRPSGSTGTGSSAVTSCTRSFCRRAEPERRHALTVAGRAELEQRMQPMLQELAALQSDAARWGTPLIVLFDQSRRAGWGARRSSAPTTRCSRSSRATAGSAA